ncbi:MAG TPA: helix-turn-helix transcriptional regulator [Thermoanaerobaculia bacterium]|nr:helix-turn-helix transcriptional regulator [Thermoanaerobaculia bacterium]
MPKTAESVQVDVVEGFSVPEKVAERTIGKGGPSAEERVGKLIAAKLAESGRSIRWAERKLGVPHRTVANLIAGRSVMRVEQLVQIAELFNTSAAALLTEALDPAAAAQAKLRQLVVPAFTWIGQVIAELHATLPVSPREEAMLAGEEEEDITTGLRAYLETFMFSTIPEAIEKLMEAAAFRPKGNL